MIVPVRRLTNNKSMPCLACVKPDYFTTENTNDTAK